MQPAKRRGRGKDHDIAWAQRIDRLFVPIEAQEFPFRWHIHLILELCTQAAVADILSILENVGHGDQFDRSVLDLQRLFRSSCAATAAPDQRDLNGVAFGRMNLGHGTGDHRRCGGQHASFFQELPTSGIIDVAHDSAFLLRWGRFE